MKTKLFLCVMFVCMAFASQAQSNADEQLQRDWFVQSVKQTTYKNAEKVEVINYQKAELLQEGTQMPQGLILHLSFERGENKVGACMSNDANARFLYVNSKGTFQINGNHLVLTLDQYISGVEVQNIYDLTYAVLGDQLTVSYTILDASDITVNYQYEITFNI